MARLDFIHGLLTDSSTADDNGVGNTYESSGNTYMWVLNHASAGAIAAGSVCMKDATTFGTVATDTTYGMIAAPAGVGIGAIAAGSYGWILIKGAYASVLKTLPTVTVDNAAGFVLTTNPNSTGLAKLLSTGAVLSAGTAKIGVSREAVGYTSTTVSAYIDCL